MKRLLAILSIGVCISAVTAAATVKIVEAFAVPRVKITVIRDTLPKYDTLYGVTATPYDVSGKRSSSSTIWWTVNPLGVVNVVPTNAKAQTVNFACLDEGAVKVKATWKRTDRVIVADSLIFRCMKPHVVSVAIYSSFNKDPMGRFIGVWDPNLVVGQSRCVYVVALDRMGGPVTGKYPTIESTNPAVATVTGNSACPDSTIDPAKLPYPTPTLPRSTSGTSGAAFSRSN